MVNNPALFNGALVGGSGGAQERWLIDQSAAHYAAFANAANTLATMVDSRIAALPGGGSIGQAQLMQSICQGVLANRYLSSLVPADYADISLAIAALFTACDAKLQPTPSEFTPTSPVYIEQYLATSGNDIRTAIRTAWLANPNCTWFIYPPGSFTFVGTFLDLADGLRNGTRHTGQNTELKRDLAGVAGSANQFFYRTQVDATHAADIVFEGFKLSLLNALTSFFGFAIGIESGSNCEIRDCWANCTLAAGATQGRIRWGFAMFGGDQTLTPPGGTNNRVTRCKLNVAQIQGCSLGRSVDGLIVSDTEVNGANDWAVSITSGVGFNVRNVIVRHTVCKDIAGSGVVFIGSDGSAANAAVLENVLVDGVIMDGQRATPDLDFILTAAVLIDGAVATENVIINNVGTLLAPNAGLQSKSVVVQSTAGEVSWNGLTISNLQLGVVTSNDPLQGLFIAGTTITGVSISNVKVRAQRGIRIGGCDNMTISNVQIFDGGLRIEADSGRNLSGIQLTNCIIRNSAAFNQALLFLSSTGRSMDKVRLCNVDLVANSVSPLVTQLTGGTMNMSIVNLENVPPSNPTAETLTGIKRFANITGFIVPTVVSVVVPVVAAAAVGYVDVSMAGTRLADLLVGEGVVAEPTQDVMAAGAGGSFTYPRVSATGVVRCAFTGAQTGGAQNFNFYRAS